MLGLMSGESMLRIWGRWEKVVGKSCAKGNKTAQMDSFFCHYHVGKQDCTGGFLFCGHCDVGKQHYTGRAAFSFVMIVSYLSSIPRDR